MKTSRKDFLKTGAILTLGTLGTSKLVPAAIVNTIALKGVNQFELPELGYAYHALEPFIDAKTMEIHYTKHHQAYINKLNEALATQPALKTQNLEQILGNIKQLPDGIKNTVRNNAGGHYNHTLFWQLLKKGTQPGSKTTALLNQTFGSIDAFKALFEKTALAQFGSGWAWLVKEKDGKLTVLSTPNQDNPLMDIQASQAKPIIAIDIWEHAYYLTYQNKRADYVKAFWNVLNWQRVEELIIE